MPLPEGVELPQLPLTEVPKGRRLTGHPLEQARVLGAAPAALRPYVERSYYGESGVDVILTTGIELRFGDDSQAARKWRAAAAVLADPAVIALDYVDLHAPAHPSSEAAATRCRGLPEGCRAPRASPCPRTACEAAGLQPPCRALRSLNLRVRGGNPQPVVETCALQDASRTFDRASAMPYVERNFRGYSGGSNP